MQLPRTARLAIEAYSQGKISATKLKELPVIIRCAQDDTLLRKMNNTVRFLRREQRNKNN